MEMGMRAGCPWLRWVGVFALVLFLLCLRAEAAVVRVTPSGAGAKDGSSWADACGGAEFRTKLTGAPGNGATEFWVAAGTYNPTAGTDRSVSFVLKTGVALYGGFGGTETARTQRNAAGNVTIFSGNIGDPASGADNSYHVVTADGVDATAVLDGFTVTGGNADVGAFSVMAPTRQGGGMYVLSASPTVAHCTFSGNGATEGGGGLFLDASSPGVAHCTFSGNGAQQGGGVFGCGSSNPTLTDCTLSNNTASQTGGGLLSGNGNPTLTRCTFSGNSAGYGGGVAKWNGGVTLADCVLSGNTASVHGGGLHNGNSGAAALTDCTLSGNTAESGGGFYNDGTSNATLTCCTLSGNTALIHGGGLYNANGGTATLTNGTLSGNNAANGGGLYNAKSATLTHCTLSGNSASSGAVVECAGNGNFTAKNCIFWNESTEEFSGALWPTVTYCVVEGGSPGTGNRSANPNLGPLADNGGPTKTHALPPGSSAVDGGTSVGAPAVDQRGVARPKGAGYDMGAYELDPAAVTPTAGPSPTPGPTSTPGPSPTPFPYPLPSGLPEPSVTVAGGTPLVSPTPVPPSDLPIMGRSNPGNVDLSPEMLEALLGAGIDPLLYQVVLTGQGGTVTYRTDPGGVVTLKIPSPLHLEGGYVYRWVCLVWNPATRRWWLPQSVRFSARSASSETWLPLPLADGGPYDLDGKADGVLTARTLNVLLAVPASGVPGSPTPTTTSPVSVSPTGSGGGGGCFLGFGLPVLLLPLLASGHRGKRRGISDIPDDKGGAPR